MPQILKGREARMVLQTKLGAWQEVGCDGSVLTPLRLMVISISAHAAISECVPHWKNDGEN